MNKSIRIALDIAADYKYVYDPDHNDKPDGMWNRTNSGWSQNDGETAPGKNVIQPNAPAKKDAPKTESTLNVEEEHSENPTSTLDPVKQNSQNEQSTDIKDDTLFDEGGNDEFVTDEEGKEEEQQETEGNGDAVEEVADDGLFDDANKDKYVDPDMYDQYIEMLNAFIEKFDDGEGKENDVTFKAVASNLDWDSMGEVTAFANHCKEKGLEGADEVIAFLYFQHQEDGEKFDKIIADMK
jgi:hypothetical protein